MKRNAFTMIELVFVIVVLGILAAIAIPKLAATRDDAQMAKGRSDVAAIRAAIVSERQTRLLQGDSSYISALDGASGGIFDGNDSTHILLQYGIAPGTGNGHWRKTNTNEYTFHVLNADTAFTYYPVINGTHQAGTFDCDHTTANCKSLTE
ncbi:type II secretion system protein [Sulfuricurvum sp.]|uniref:type II secretion system protein n=1 Tax=Sulfuricurvum sp. TaxID=2025608 RepID=UPI003567D5D0